MRMRGSMMILMIGSICVSSILSAHIYDPSIRTDIHNHDIPEYLIIDKESWVFTDNSRNITLNIGIDRLPYGPGRMDIISYDYPSFTEENAKDRIETIFPEIDESPERVNSDRYRLQTPSSSINYFPSTAIQFDRLDLDHNPSDVVIMKPDIENGTKGVLSEDYIHLEQAHEIAKGFIEDHGGIPGDGRLDACDAMRIEDMGTGFEYNSSYAFLYTRYIDDEYRVVGGGEEILLIMNNIGLVEGYIYSWMSDLKSQREEISIYTSKEALDAIGYVPIMGQDTRRTITEVELGYYYPNCREKQDELRPVWVFCLDGSKGGLYIDAVTLEQY